MIEVCSTMLPQLAIPKIMSHPSYAAYRKEANARIGRRSKLMEDVLAGVKGIKFNKTKGAFYNTIIFDESLLNEKQFLPVPDRRIQSLLEGWLLEKEMPHDKRFVYNLLAADQICVVPVSSFCSDLRGFRVTLLEEDESVFEDTFVRLAKSIEFYLKSSERVAVSLSE
jgi:aspartate/methionine/tyrosine aminotransferase